MKTSVNRNLITSAILLLILGLIVAAGSLKWPRLFTRPTADAATAAQGGGDPKITDSALRQIQALMREKESRTPAQRKLDSQLLYTLKMRRGQEIAAGLQIQETSVAVDRQAKTVVDITAVIGGTLLEDLANRGAEIISVFPQYRSLRASVPLDQLEAIAAFPQVRFIQPKQEAVVEGNLGEGETAREQSWRQFLSPGFAGRAERVRAFLSDALPGLTQDRRLAPAVGSKNSEGDVTHRVNTARSNFGFNGAGVKIGVLSDGISNLASSQVAGDLPPNIIVLPGQAGSGDEGTAMLEIIQVRESSISRSALLLRSSSTLRSTPLRPRPEPITPPRPGCKARGSIATALPAPVGSPRPVPASLRPARAATTLTRSTTPPPLQVA
jgi:hypothetical protein